MGWFSKRVKPQQLVPDEIDIQVPDEMVNDFIKNVASLVPVHRREAFNKCDVELKIVHGKAHVIFTSTSHSRIV